jgi:hypothetical protein
VEIAPCGKKEERSGKVGSREGVYCLKVCQSIGGKYNGLSTLLPREMVEYSQANRTFRRYS